MGDPKKSRGVTYGDLGVDSIKSLLPIHLGGNVWSRYCPTVTVTFCFLVYISGSRAFVYNAVKTGTTSSLSNYRYVSSVLFSIRIWSNVNFWWCWIIQCRFCVAQYLQFLLCHLKQMYVHLTKECCQMTNHFFAKLCCGICVRQILDILHLVIFIHLSEYIILHFYQ